MHCPACQKPTLVEQPSPKGCIVDVCSGCKGVWLDRGEIYLFSRRPKQLALAMAGGLAERKPTERECPRCKIAMEEGRFLGKGPLVDQCPRCEGIWFDAGELKQAIELDRQQFDLQVDGMTERRRKAVVEPDSAAASTPEETDVQARQRLAAIAAGMIPLPNLFLRSASVLFFLYGLLALVLITLVELSVLLPGVALAIGAVIVVLQYALGPWIMDLSLRWLYTFSWLQPNQLPPHLREFIERVTKQEGMGFPWVGLIHDGAPNAFTYGHTPGNMRVVISQGILDLLQPAEVEAVVAHELGHGKHWDMALMTLAQLVPLILYYVYRILIEMKTDSEDKSAPARIAIAVGAYVLYIVSQYVVLWFSRCREYHADRFAGRVTGNPNALSGALVKIAYGLAARGGPETSTEAGKGKQAQARGGRLEALGALGIFDAGSARGLVVAAASGTSAEGPGAVGKENLMGAMQWDLWNPWAKWYELHSTHPLVAHRLSYLGEQAASLGQEPYIVFDRRKPESYWDEFLVDVLVMFLPTLLGAAAVGAGIAVGAGGVLAGGAIKIAPLLGLFLLGAGVGSLVKTLFSYRGDFFAPLSVAGLLHKVKVSAIRPVPAQLKGTIVGKGVPGLIWSEDFVMRDGTGILFLDYRQPLAIWEWLFGLFRAGQFTGKEVEVTGWFRRAPVPFLEVKSFTVGGQTRTCYVYHVKLAWAVILAAAGIALGIAAPF